MGKKWKLIAVTGVLAAMMTMSSYAGTWIQDRSRPADQDGVSNWWYREDDGSFPFDDWCWIDGNGDGIAECYRFDQSGWMYTDTSVDGYVVDAAGAWTENGVEQKKLSAQSGKGTQDSRSEESVGDSSGTTVQKADNTELSTGLEKKSEKEREDLEVYNRIMALKSEFPEGKTWTNSNSYQSGYRIGFGCAAFVFIVQDNVFGKNAVKTKVYEMKPEDFRVGDHVRLYNSSGTDEHSVVVLKVDDEGITVCEGNYNNSMHWGRKIPWSELGSKFIYRETCY
jgi:hypothetical protein